MKILIFGKTGQVATELQRQADVIALGRDTADLSNPEACAAAIRAHAPDAVINAAAYTAVDKAETEEAEATVINGTTPGAMAQTCAELGIPFVHISTDYVFAGTGTDAWRPDDAVDPLNAYGRSKLAGETAVIAAGGSYGILRTSWVFSSHGANFVKTMLRLGESRDSLTVVADQIGGPTPAAGIASTCLIMAKALAKDASLSGVHHYSGSPDVSWADFARAIFDEAKLNVTVGDIPGSQFPTPAARPSNSRMDCSALKRDFGVDRPDWRAALQDVLKDLEISK